GDDACPFPKARRQDLNLQPPRPTLPALSELRFRRKRGALSIELRRGQQVSIPTAVRNRRVTFAPSDMPASKALARAARARIAMPHVSPCVIAACRYSRADGIIDSNVIARKRRRARIVSEHRALQCGSRRGNTLGHGHPTTYHNFMPTKLSPSRHLRAERYACIESYRRKGADRNAGCISVCAVAACGILAHTD